ncbi:MAG: hypothetical protein N2689_11600, partial [Verrucomicrobiae bacterium]|nr:hypothetical protein [Verrucomicrobiae bacterium]
LVMSGVNLRTVQELAGRKKIKMTMRYTRHVTKLKQWVIGHLEGHLEPEAEDKSQNRPKAKTEGQSPNSRHSSFGRCGKRLSPP